MTDNYNEPQSRNEALLQNILGATNPIGTPQSRNEAILKAILDGLDEIPAPYVAPPQSRIEELLVELWENGGGGGATLIEKSIVENGEYNAADDSADGYSSVKVNVPPTLFKQLVNGNITSIAEGDLSGITTIFDYTFYNRTTLTSVVFSNTITAINQYAFYGCTGLTKIDIPSNVLSIGLRTFMNASNVATVTMHEGLTTIGDNAFRSCAKITELTLPSTVTTIEAQAFTSCSALNGITILAGTPPTLVNSNAFVDTNNCPIYVPAESVDTYKGATNWTSLASRIFAIQE